MVFSPLNYSFSDHGRSALPRGFVGAAVIYYYNKGFVCASDAPASIPFSPSRNRPNSSVRVQADFAMVVCCPLGRRRTRTDIGRWHFEYEGNNDDERLGPLSLTWKESTEEGGKWAKAEGGLGQYQG